MQTNHPALLSKRNGPDRQRPRRPAARGNQSEMQRLRPVPYMAHGRRIPGRGSRLCLGALPFDRKAQAAPHRCITSTKSDDQIAEAGDRECVFLKPKADTGSLNPAPALQTNYRASTGKPPEDPLAKEIQLDSLATTTVPVQELPVVWQEPSPPVALQISAEPRRRGRPHKRYGERFAIYRRLHTERKAAAGKLESAIEVVAKELSLSRRTLFTIWYEGQVCDEFFYRAEKLLMTH